MYTTEGRKVGYESKEVNEFIMENMFSTITNANFDRNDFIHRIERALEVRENVKKQWQKQEERLKRLPTMLQFLQ